MVLSGYGRLSGSRLSFHPDKMTDASPFELKGSWTVFAHPVQSAAVVNAKSSTLNDVLLCTSEDGTVALLSLTDLDL